MSVLTYSRFTEGTPVSVRGAEPSVLPLKGWNRPELLAVKHWQIIEFDWHGNLAEFRWAPPKPGEPVRH